MDAAPINDRHRLHPYIIDAIIGVSVVDKAFENMGGFERLIGFRPDTRAAVMVFGLFHRFGLATKLQEFTVAKNGLVTNIVSFNVGVEIGRVLALTAVLIGISYWRRHTGFLRHSFAANTVLMAGGLVLMGYQSRVTSSGRFFQEREVSCQRGRRRHNSCSLLRGRA